MPQKLKYEFALIEEELKRVFSLPHTAVSEPYVKAFQFKILNSILFTNNKIFKIGYSERDKCTFCDKESETLHHLFYYCPHSNLLWQKFEEYYLTVKHQRIKLSLKDIILGKMEISRPILDYLLLIAKIHIWDCRRNGVRPYIERFKSKIKIKFETEKYIAMKSHKLRIFKKKWEKYKITRTVISIAL